MGRLNQMHSIVTRPKKGNAPIMFKIPKTNANEIKKRNNGFILKKKKKEVIEPYLLLGTAELLRQSKIQTVSSLLCSSCYCR